jgi:hypothetical protein
VGVGEHRITVRASVADFGIAADGRSFVNVAPPRGK